MSIRSSFAALALAAPAAQATNLHITNLSTKPWTLSCDALEHDLFVTKVGNTGAGEGGHQGLGCSRRVVRPGSSWNPRCPCRSRSSTPKPRIW